MQAHSVSRVRRKLHPAVGLRTAGPGCRVARGGACLEDALALFRAGEPLDVVADEDGVPRPELEGDVRIATSIAA